MVDVAGELGVDAIGLNHLMFSTPEEVAETVRLIGVGDASAISTFVTSQSRPRPRTGAAQVDALPRVQASGHPLRHAAEGQDPIVTDYYTPGTALEGRCLYPFLYARVSFSGKAYFCPFIRIEVGDLTTQSLEEVWTGDAVRLA